MKGKNIKVLSFLLVLSALLYKMADSASADEIKFPVLTTATQQQVAQPVVQQQMQQQYSLVPASSVNGVVSQPVVYQQQPVQQQVAQQPVVYQVAQQQPQQQDYIHIESEEKQDIQNKNKRKTGFDFKMNIFLNSHLALLNSSILNELGGITNRHELLFDGQKEKYVPSYNINVGGGFDLLYRFDNDFALFLGIEGTYNIKKNTVTNIANYERFLGYFSVYEAMNEEVKENFDISGRLGLSLKMFGTKIMPYVSFGIANADYRAKGVIGYINEIGELKYDKDKGIYEVEKTTIYGAKLGLGADLLIMDRLLLGIRYSASVFDRSKYLDDMFNYYEVTHESGTNGEVFYNELYKQSPIIHNIGLRIGIQLF